MNKLTNVSCTYTGGNIWVYTALFNNEVWLYGGLDSDCFDSFDIDPIQYEKDHSCSFDCPSDHLAVPTIPYPTFGEILDSIRDNCSDEAYEYAESFMRMNNVGFSNLCITANDATLESVFTGKSGTRISIWRFGWNDYSASWGDMSSVRGTMKQILDELKGEL